MAGFLLKKPTVPTFVPSNNKKLQKDFGYLKNRSIFAV